MKEEPKKDQRNRKPREPDPLVAALMDSLWSSHCMGNTKTGLNKTPVDAGSEAQIGTLPVPDQGGRPITLTEHELLLRFGADLRRRRGGGNLVAVANPAGLSKSTVSRLSGDCVGRGTTPC